VLLQHFLNSFIFQKSSSNLEFEQQFVANFDQIRQKTKILFNFYIKINKKTKILKKIFKKVLKMFDLICLDVVKC